MNAEWHRSELEKAAQGLLVFRDEPNAPGAVAVGVIEAVSLRTGMRMRNFQGCVAFREICRRPAERGSWREQGAPNAPDALRTGGGGPAVVASRQRHAGDEAAISTARTSMTTALARRRR
jgi:hypothetical protein